MTITPLRARNWRRSLGGGQTEPQVFECSDGRDWVIKLQGNPHGGVRSLCADWIGTEIARTARVNVPAATLVEVGTAALATATNPPPWARPGVALGSMLLTETIDVTGVHSILRAAAPVELLRIAAVDTWLDVLDRKKPAAGEWNLLLDSSGSPPRLVVIDYGLSLTEVLGVPLIGAPPNVQPRIPAEWVMHLHAEDIPAVLADILSVTDAQVREIVDCVPPEWVSVVPGVRQVPAYLAGRRPQMETCLRGGLSA